MLSVSGLSSVVLMVLVWTGGRWASPLRPICDPHVLVRFIREAQDTEVAMRSCKEGCGAMRTYTVPLTSVDFAEWEQKDAEAQAAEVHKGLSLMIQALHAVRESVSNSALCKLLENNISNMHSLSHIIHSLLSQAQSQTLQRRTGHTKVRLWTASSLPELFRVQTNFLRGKVKLLLSAVPACRSQSS